MCGEYKRLDYIDVIKGMCIFLVVFGHLAERIEPIPSVFHVIYAFHMPVMFFCSGVVSEVSWKNNGGEWIQKKFKSLLIPYIIWSFLNPLILLGVGRFNIIDTLNSTFISNQSYWYLICLSILSTVYYLVQKSRYNTRLIPVALFVVSVAAFVTKNPYIEQAMKYFPFFYMGVIMVRFDIIQKLIVNDWIIVCSCLLFFVLVRTFDKFNSSFYMLGIRCLCGVLAIPTFIKISKAKIFENKLGAILRSFGKNSLIIYLCHYFFICDLNVVKILKMSSVETIIYVLGIAAFICMVCTFIGKVLEENKILKKILLGRSR